MEGTKERKMTNSEKEENKKNRLEATNNNSEEKRKKSNRYARKPLKVMERGRGKRGDKADRRTNKRQGRTLENGEG